MRKQIAPLGRFNWNGRVISLHIAERGSSLLLSPPVNRSSLLTPMESQALSPGLWKIRIVSGSGRSSLTKTAFFGPAGYTPYVTLTVGLPLNLEAWIKTYQ